MTTSPAFWRRLTYALALALAITGWSLYVRTGYPKEWDQVRYGMHGAEVWFLCGKPTSSSGGMKADHWSKPFLFGQWEFKVNCGDVYGGDPGPVTDITLYFETFITGKTWIKKYSPELYIVDYQAYKRAFGFHDEPRGGPEPPGAAQEKR